MKIEGSNQESNMNNDSTSETKNFSSTIYDQYQKYISIYEKFSLNEQVTTVRESINKVLEKIPKDVIPTPDEKLKDYVQRPVYEFSETANTQYPYISSLCRTHGVMIVGASTVAAMILLRATGSKAMVFGTLSTLALSQGAVSSVNYKWNYPKPESSENEKKSDN